jgi:hypothetical protein
MYELIFDENDNRDLTETTVDSELKTPTVGKREDARFAILLSSPFPCDRNLRSSATIKHIFVIPSLFVFLNFGQKEEERLRRRFLPSQNFPMTEGLGERDGDHLQNAQMLQL